MNVSDQTIRSRLHESSLNAQRPVAGPVLTAWHCGARLSAATENRIAKASTGDLNFSLLDKVKEGFFFLEVSFLFQHDCASKHQETSIKTW